jgi:hypothetical protein
MNSASLLPNRLTQKICIAAASFHPPKILTPSAGNGNVGFTANAGYFSVSDSLLSNNYIGIAAGGGVVTVSNTMIASSSLRALYTAGSGQLLTFGNNQLSGKAGNGNFTGAVPLQ